MNEIKLTQYSHGAGCGCKISPRELSEILHSQSEPIRDNRLLVGNESSDDAAVYDLDDGTAIISTTDFFMPIVDDPYTFGRIAAVNAISDIYAMGGKPLLAIAILGWPVAKLKVEVAQQVLEGGRFACKEAGIILAGGHSIDSPEPIFGLAVTGQVAINNLKKNNTAMPGSRLYLTKPIGVGILTTAQKQGKLKAEHAAIASGSMIKPNSVGMELAKIKGVTAMTDVTGFGLLGHLSEICNGSQVSAILEFDKIPKFAEAEEYITFKCIPGGTYRNWDCYGSNILLRDPADRIILCDPQTSGGLLVAAEERICETVEKILTKFGIESVPIGRLQKREDYLIRVV
jgi:selenide,water dikinase